MIKSRERNVSRILIKLFIQMNLPLDDADTERMKQALLRMKQVETQLYFIKKIVTNKCSNFSNIVSLTPINSYHHRQVVISQ